MASISKRPITVGNARGTYSSDGRGRSRSTCLSVFTVVAIVSTFHTILGQKQDASAAQNSCSRSQSASKQTGLAGGRPLQAIRAKRVKETPTTMAYKIR